VTTGVCWYFLNSLNTSAPIWWFTFGTQCRRKRRIDLHYGGVLQPVGVRGIVGRAQPDIIVVRVFAHLHYPNDNRMLFGVDAARVDVARSQYEAGKKSVVLCLDFTWRGTRGGGGGAGEFSFTSHDMAPGSEAAAIS